MVPFKPSYSFLFPHHSKESGVDPSGSQPFLLIAFCLLYILLLQICGYTPVYILLVWGHFLLANYTFVGNKLRLSV
uniref:Uncharacterized protein n=1 Tax=Anguilla anguilla TaxID=7936 RepID=A0A0E9T7N8_ANGAN